MELNPQQIEALLEILLNLGVEEFEGWGFHVKFKLDALPPEREQAQAPDRTKVSHEAKYPPKPENPWKNPSLWPGGAPPSFPMDED